jgi:endo-1,4-beta-xylanase
MFVGLNGPRCAGIGLGMALLLTASDAMLGQTKILHAVFTPVPVKVDGAVEKEWDRAVAEPIALCMNVKLTEPKSGCAVTGTVQALWSGPVLYLLFRVQDTEIATSSKSETERSGVQIFVDQYDDKSPKFEEDDGYVTISATGEQTGNRTNANLQYFPAVGSTHLQSYAAQAETDAEGRTTGYRVEMGWWIGDLPLKNGTRLGMEFALHAAAGPTHGEGYHLFWSSGDNKGVNDNTNWGEVVLSGYGGTTPMPLNTYMLEQNIRKAKPAESSADGLVRGIWTDEGQVDRALVAARTVLHIANRQADVDAANAALDAALRGLRRSGKYPDPYDLPSRSTLPDPFRFFDGKRVRAREDWEGRRAEIKDLAQYYEFGRMPRAPQKVTAVSTSGEAGALRYNNLEVTVEDAGKTVTFKPILYLPADAKPPYPVIVEEDFAASPKFAPPNPAYLRGGYAVLSIPTTENAAFKLSGIASDDGNHTGAFFALYPYRLDAEGDDRGVLLAWAWGASRGVDALEYLVSHDPAYADLLDVKKLVVTGFSRWGKAALLAGMMDERFLVTAPGGSGSGGAAPYRYDSFGNRPFRSAPFGNVYPWGRSPGAESMADHVRHQTHNSNEMLRRFLNDTTPAAVVPRMYLTTTWGYGDRLPFDHHEEIAAIAPRAVMIENTNDDYADNAEGDAIGYEGALPVYEFLGAAQNLALDISMQGGGHSLKASQAENLVHFADMVLFGKPLPAEVKAHLSSDPYKDAGTFDTYYGGLGTMMPWLQSH